MIIFADSSGFAQLILPSAIMQGGVDANEIALVCPFPSAVVEIAFTLPNGMVIGPKIASYPMDAQKYTLTERGSFENYYVYTYNLRGSITALSGTLGIQFFININDGTEEAPLASKIIPTNLVNVQIYNGSRYLPKSEVLTTNKDLMSFLSSMQNALIEKVSSSDFEDFKTTAVSKKETNRQIITGPITVRDDVTAAEIKTNKITPEAGTEITIHGVTFKKQKIGGEGDYKYVIEADRAEFKDEVEAGSIKASGAVSVGENLDVSGNSTLGHTANVIGTDGKPTITLNGNLGTVSANVVSTKAEFTNKLRTNQITSNIVAPINIFRESIDGTQEKATLNLYGSLIVSDNIDVGGNLNIKGETINQIQESIIVKDNIIVTNSSGASFSVSGIVMRTSLPDENDPNNPSEAYGILYSPRPTDDAVMIGKGTLTEIPNVTTGAVTYEFEFAEGEALPLAARSGFGESSNGYIPQWDSNKNAFVPYELSANDIATKDSVEALRAEIGDLEKFFNELNNGGTES